MKKNNPSHFPRGWNRKKVEALIRYYEKQTDDAAIAEAEAAYRKRTSALVEVPLKFLPQVRKLITRRRAG